MRPTATWRLENSDVAIDVEQQTGLIRSLLFKQAGVDLFQQVRGGIGGYVGCLRIYDEADDRWYDDLRTPFAVSNAALEGNAVRMSRTYEGAPFTIDLALRLEADAFHWEVHAAKLSPDVPDRSLRVYFLFPLIAGWDVWAPCRFGEITFDGMTPFEFMYVQTPYVSEQEIILPMVSHYHRKLNVGYSMMQPIDARVPAAKFVFNNGERCFNWGSMHKDPRTVPVLEAINYYVGLVGERPMDTKVMLMFHEGDWRCGLGAVYRRWREYFDPYNPAIYDREGCFLCGSVDLADEIQPALAMGLKTLEVHGHFQDYCDYFNEGKDRWYRINTKERVYHRLVKERPQDSPAVTAWDVEEFFAAHSDEQIAAYIGADDVGRLCHRREDVKRRLKTLADAGIACHWYFNYTDGYRPRVEKAWPDSISADEDGAYWPSGWYMCHNMNADPRFSFGRFLIATARRICEEYPTLSGFFLDCFRHYDIDFAHDDGVTVVNSRPAYSINHSYDEIERIIKEDILRPRNMTSFANKPMTVRTMRYCDGQLLEGSGDMYEEKFFWASIASPLFFLFSTRHGPVEEFLRRSVLHGAFPTLVERTEANIALYRRYLPLYELFRRRVLCFEPDPLRAPPHSRAKLYTVPDGYVAGIANLHLAPGDVVAYARTPHAVFRVARAHDVTRAAILTPGDAAPRDVPFKFDGTFLAVPLAGYNACAAVKLFVTANTGRTIGPDTFATRPEMCSDPESAFADIGQR